MTRQKPTTYRAFSIEQETDGSFSIFRMGYVAGGFRSAEEAKRSVDGRLD